MDLAYVLCVYVMIGYVDVPLGLLTVRVKDVSDAFTFFSDPSPPTGLPRSALIQGYVPSHIGTCSAMFG